MLDARATYDGIKADLWAAGITLFFLIYGNYPFYSNNFIDVFDNIKN